MIWTPESDPAFAGESHKYDRPIPSRAFLLQWLHDRGLPTTAEDLIADIGLADQPDQVEAVTRRLAAMERDGQLVCNRRGAYGRNPRRRGLTAERAGRASALSCSPLYAGGRAGAVR